MNTGHEESCRDNETRMYSARLSYRLVHRESQRRKEPRACTDIHGSRHADSDPCESRYIRGLLFLRCSTASLAERKHARVPRGTILRASRGHVPRQARRDSQGRKEPRAAASRSVPEFYFRMTARIARISTDHTTEALIRVCSVQKPWRSFSYIAMPCSMWNIFR